MQPALEELLAELVLGAELPPTEPRRLVAWLEQRGVSSPDAQAIAETELTGLLTYRELVRQTLRGAVERAIPRSMARLGDTFDVFFERFLAEQGPRTNYLRDVTRELLGFIDGSDRAGLPGYWLDLARHESLHIEVAAAPAATRGRPGAALDLEAGLGFSESVRLCQYDYAVHELPDDLADRTLPVREPTHILAYRDAEHDVRYLALSAFAATLLRGLLAGKSLGESLLGASREHGVPLDEANLNATAALLANLSDRGVLTGPCAIGSARADDPANLGTGRAAVPHPSPEPREAKRS